MQESKSGSTTAQRYWHYYSNSVEQNNGKYIGTVLIGIVTAIGRLSVMSYNYYMYVRETV